MFAWVMGANVQRYRVLNEDGQWVADRTEYYRNRWYGQTPEKLEAARKRHREALREKMKDAAYVREKNARENDRRWAIFQRTGLKASDFARLRKAIKQKHAGYEERLQAFKAAGLLTEREERFLTTRVPMPPRQKVEGSAYQRQRVRDYKLAIEAMTGLTYYEVRKRRAAAVKKAKGNIALYYALVERAGVMSPREQVRRDAMMKDMRHAAE